MVFKHISIYLNICLYIYFQGVSDNWDGINDGDLSSIITLALGVSKKFALLSGTTSLLIAQTCQHVCKKVVDLEQPSDLQHYFECLNLCLNAKNVDSSSVLLIIFEIIERCYNACNNE